MCRNENKETPLHVACQNHASVRVIEYLVQKNRDILGWQDQDGNLPLHYIFKTFCVSEMVALLRLHMPLLPQCPIALMCKNENKKTPLHIACQDNASVRVIEYLVQKNWGHPLLAGPRWKSTIALYI
jgi:ankyrin repeat protein